MPSKRKQSEGMLSVPELTVPAEFLDQLVQGPMTQGEVEAVCRSLKKAVIERAMGAELSQHLGYAPGEPKPAEQDNHRNGTTGKTVLTDDGPQRKPVDLTLKADSILLDTGATIVTDPKAKVSAITKMVEKPPREQAPVREPPTTVIHWGESSTVSMPWCSRKRNR